jgi:hypothetical protein
MAFEHGKGSVFKIDNSGGTLTDISAFCNNVDFPREVDVPETTTFGNSDRTYIAGLRTATVSVSGYWDATVDATLAGVQTTAVSLTFEFGPQGASSGAVRYTGECFPTGYNVTGPVDGVSTWTADFQITGSVTRNTYT